MWTIGILLAVVGVLLKGLLLGRQVQKMLADLDDGVTWLAAWRKYGWYRQEDIVWLLPLTAGGVLMFIAYWTS